VAEIFVQLVHRLETNTINSLWANWIRAAQQLLRIHHPEMKAKERDEHFEKIMRGECSDHLLPLLPLSTEHVRKAIALLQCSLLFLHHRNRTLSCLTRSRDCLPSLSATSISASSPGGILSGICIASRHSTTRTQACAPTLITARVFPPPSHPLLTNRKTVGALLEINVKAMAGFMQYLIDQKCDKDEKMKHALCDTAVKKVRVGGSKQPPSGTIAAANMEMEKCYAEIDTEEYKKKYNRPRVAVWSFFFFFFFFFLVGAQKPKLPPRD
jgi:hypothetical protein